MNALSRATRMRSRFMSFGLSTSAVTFFVIEGDALVDQSEIGHASAMFMFGTACLAAAFCIGLFAIIMTIGLAISAAFSDEPPQQQSLHRDIVAADANTDQPPAASLELGRSSTNASAAPPIGSISSAL
jgi:hypothetical protein